MASPTELLFYEDWKFWSFLVSGFALVLSQIPPIRILIKPKKLDVEVHNRVQITHKIGNPNFSMHVSLINSGGRKLRIMGLKINIYRDGSKLITLPAQNYYESPKDQTGVLFVPFTLKPEECWSHSVNFLNFFDRPTEKMYRDCERNLRLNIQQKIKSRAENDNEPVKADEIYIKPFSDLFNKLFVWFPGEYIFELIVDTNPSSANFNKKFRFTLFESDTKELQDQINDYPYGGGLYFNVESHVGVFISISEHIG